MKEKHKHILFCGYNVFPHGFAQTQRLKLIAKGLKINNVHVEVLCRYGTYKKNVAVESVGNVDGVKYRYLSGSSYRSDSFFVRNLRKVVGFFREPLYIINKKIKGELDYIFIETNYFRNVLFYSLLSRILFTKCIIDNIEFWTAVRRHKWSLGEKLYDRFSPVLCHKVICISDYLVEYAQKYKNQKDILKVPAIVDFDKFSTIKREPQKEPYVLFCGSAVYYPIIFFIIEAFEKMKQEVNLILVSSNGSKSDYDKIKAKIHSASKSEKIDFKSNIPYRELVELYVNSQALLIPLRDTVEDKARFPHKLGEYTASRGIIVTTGFGEVLNYFHDKGNALVAQGYDNEKFAEKIDYAIQNQKSLDSLREKAYQTGLVHFDYRSLGANIYNFLFK